MSDSKRLPLDRVDSTFSDDIETICAQIGFDPKLYIEFPRKRGSVFLAPELSPVPDPAPGPAPWPCIEPAGKPAIKPGNRKSRAAGRCQSFRPGDSESGRSLGESDPSDSEPDNAEPYGFPSGRAG